MQLNPAAFNALLSGVGDGLGEWFTYRKSAACPCLNPTSGSPTRNCPHCGGKGRLWGGPVRAHAGVASSKVQQEWARLGQWESGDMVLSIPEDSQLYEIGQFDRVTSSTSSDPFSLPLIRGAVDERIHGQIKAISRVFWFDNSSQIVEGSAMPTVQPNGTLAWPSGSGTPPAGRAYSITGERWSEWYCYGAFSSDRMKHGGARLPRRMVLRAFDLLGRNGSQ